ncbi:MAG: sigma-70 family RNA polymerase sigma factor [Chloroflexota bacterium]|nr:sigma-70 family RNA polymerase sigma factor [Chloroflexota bacterium]
MGMSRGEHGDRGAGRARGETVAALAMLASTAYADHADALRSRFAAYTRDQAAAEDLVHETFVRLLIELAAGRQPRHLRGWLFRVGLNLATSRARHHKVARRRAPELVWRGVAPSPEDELIERESAALLTGRLAALPHDVRAALLLSADGYSGAEIARRIGRSELATRSLICRHRRGLRDSVAAA